MDITKKKEIMKNLYTSSKRAQEITTLTIAVVLILLNLFYYFKSYDINSVMVAYSLVGIILGMCLADFCGGFVHWAADTWFTIDLPILGPNLIRPFREHHIDPSSILDHDFIETNADTFTLTIPFTLINAYRHFAGQKFEDDYFYDSFLISLCIFVSFTNEFHKWSHDYKGRTAIVSFFQSWNIILPREHHRIHHVRPHCVYYCITTGWLDAPLEMISFWRNLEALITLTTGHIPRQDDKKWTDFSKK